MLSSLMIKDFVIIDEMRVDFENGFNVITGETGAGKSLIIGAILQISGARMDQSLIRKGADKAVIEAQFFVSNSSLRNEFDLDENGSGEIILTRELHANGKSLARINNRMVSNQILKTVASELVSVFGQHDKVKLFDDKEQLKILDGFVLPGNEALFEAVSMLSKRHKTLLSEKKALAFEDEASVEREKELIRYQMNDIDAVNLTEEDETIEEVFEKAKNAQSILENLTLCRFYLENEEERSVLQLLNLLIKTMDGISAYDKDYLAVLEKLEDLKYAFHDIRHFLDLQVDSFDRDPAMLFALEKRLDEINLLKKKYGPGLEDIQTFRVSLEEKLEALDSLHGRREALEEEIRRVEEEYFARAGELSRLRQAKALEISKEISRNLQDLNFKSAEFHIQFEPGDRIDVEGFDTIEFMVKINTGSDFAPLRKVASGGELSRVMLAIQESVAKAYHIPVLIFDEIDTGISGKAASAMAKKMYSVSLTHQLIVVTHLLQVALFGDHHYLIEKRDEGESTVTRLSLLDKDLRIDEVYRLISTDKESLELREEAKKMIESADETKLRITERKG